MKHVWKNLNTYRRWSWVGGCQGESGRRRQTQTHVEETQAQIHVGKMETHMEKHKHKHMRNMELGWWLSRGKWPKETNSAPGTGRGPQAQIVRGQKEWSGLVKKRS